MERRAFIRFALIGSGTLLLVPSALLSTPSSDGDAITITMLYNNMGTSDTLIDAWGFSLLVETSDSAVLFDTGGVADILLTNIEHANKSLENLTDIIISHNHWDHTTGLGRLLQETEYRPLVSVPHTELAAMQNLYPEARFAGVGKPVKISNSVWSTGAMEGTFRDETIHEQAIIVEFKDQILLFAGCSHPGIVNFVERARNIFPDKRLALVGGGFHLVDLQAMQIEEIAQNLRRHQVEKVAPSHCTGDKAISIFQEIWGKDFVKFELGDSLQL